MFFLHCGCKGSVFDPYSRWNHGAVQADPSLSGVLHYSWSPMPALLSLLASVATHWCRGKRQALGYDKPSGRINLAIFGFKASPCDIWTAFTAIIDTETAIPCSWRSSNMNLKSSAWCAAKQERHPKQRLFDLMFFISTIAPTYFFHKAYSEFMLWCMLTSLHALRWIIPVSMSLSTIRIGPHFSWIVKRLRFDVCTNGGASTSLYGLTLACACGGVITLSSGLIVKKDDIDCKQYQILYSGGVLCSVVSCWEIPPKNEEYCTSKNWKNTKDSAI